MAAWMGTARQRRGDRQCEAEECQGGGASLGEEGRSVHAIVWVYEHMVI